MKNLSVLSAVLLLAACGGSNSNKDKGSAPGELLGRTVSDAMIKPDRLRSSPPAAEQAARPANLDALQPKIRTSDRAVADEPVSPPPQAAPESAATPDAAN